MKRLLPVACLLAALPAFAQQPVPRTQTPAQSAPLGAGIERPLPPRVEAAPTAAAEYDACLRKAANQPEAAYEDATGWARTRGGGEPAQHCAAVALFNAGQWRRAAEAFTDLAGRYRDRRALLRASLVAQAGRAWLAADEPARAVAALSAAIDIAPDSAIFWIDRAEARAAAGGYWEAIDDLNRALDLDPRRGEAYALRAAAYRRVEALDLAREDADRAVELAPKFPEAWLERGILKRLANDAAGARRDWREVLLLEPDGAAAEAARAQIEAMELDPSSPPPQRRR
jgi:tetratricopeptide (TPR) repeat protein